MVRSGWDEWLEFDSEEAAINIQGEPSRAGARRTRYPQRING